MREQSALARPALIYGLSKSAIRMLTVQYANVIPEIRFNAVEPGIAATDLTGEGGRLVAGSAKLIVEMAIIGGDGPTGT